MKQKHNKGQVIGEFILGKALKQKQSLCEEGRQCKQTLFRIATWHQCEQIW